MTRKSPFTPETRYCPDPAFVQVSLHHRDTEFPETTEQIFSVVSVISVSLW